MSTATKIEKVVNTEVTISELYKAFHKLNEAFYNNELPLPMIVILETAKKNAYGWFTPNKIWKDKEQEVEMHEIAMSAEFMNRDFLEVMKTLHHEMIHLYCHVKGIKDTTKKGKYHNDNFKKVSEEHGFFYKEGQEADPKLGWSFSLLTEETKKTIEAFGLDKDAFKMARALEVKVKKKKNRSTYKCEPCEVSLRGKGGLRVICGECEEEMIEIPSK